MMTRDLGIGFSSKVAACMLTCVLAVIGYCVAPSTAYADDAWQIVSGQYEGNEPANKTTHNDEIRIQKNVMPTDVENEFQVYMAIDAKCSETVTSTKITEVLSDETLLNSLYTGGSANGFPDAIDGQEHEGNGALADKLKGSPKPCEPGNIRFKLIITYEKDGHVYTIAEPILSLGVPNSVLYLKVGDKYICLENIQLHGNKVLIGGETPDQDSDGNYIVPVHLTTMSYEALLTTHTSEIATTTSTLIVGEDGSASIEDPIGNPSGSYIVYDGFVSGDVENPPAASTEPGGTVKWQLKPKEASKPTDASEITETIETTTETDEQGNTTEVTVISRSWWQKNIAEITYKAHLAVDKAGFTSGTVYPVNGPTTITYGDGKTAEFPVPTVKGTLYDFEFTKVDDAGTTMPGVTFTLTGPASNPDVASSSKTLTSDGSGKVSTTNLPWGEYTLTETVPAGYTGSTLPTLQIGYTEWPDGVTHKDAANDVYKFPNDSKVVNTKNKVTVTKAVKVDGELTEDKINHTIYIALKDRNTKEYLTDENGDLIYKTITISNGVPSPESVTFECVPSGVYDVWELKSTDPVKELAVGDVIAEPEDGKIKVHSISATNDGGSGNNADLTKGPEAKVDFTNTYSQNPLIQFVANKKWATYSGENIDAPEGAEATFVLYRYVENSPEDIEEVASITLDGTPDPSAENTGEVVAVEQKAWEATFKNLPEMDDDDNKYTYQVKEASVPENYTPYLGTTPMTESDYLTQNGGAITNRKQMTDVTVKKVVEGPCDEGQKFSFKANWGEEPESFELADGEEKVLKDVPVGAKLTVAEEEDEDFSTSVTCGNDTQEAAEYEYTVAEPTDDIVFTNTREVTTATVTKVWDDDEDAAGIRPETIDVQLTADGDAYGDPVTLKESDNWTYTWDNLPLTKDGEEIEYSVAEVDAPAGYTAGDPEVVTTADGATITITNTYEPEPANASISVTKELVVAEGSEAPSGMTWTVSLEGDKDAPMPDDTRYAVAPGQTVTFGDIVFPVAGDYTYTIEESGAYVGVKNDPEPKVVTISVEDNGEGVLVATPDSEKVTFTNVYTAPGEGSIVVAKNLEGGSLKAGQFTFELVDDKGEVIQTKTNDADGQVEFDKITYDASVFEDDSPKKKAAALKVASEGAGSEPAAVAAGESSAAPADEAAATEAPAGNSASADSAADNSAGEDAGAGSAENGQSPAVNTPAGEAGDKAEAGDTKATDEKDKAGAEESEKEAEAEGAQDAQPQRAVAPLSAKSIALVVLANVPDQDGVADAAGEEADGTADAGTPVDVPATGISEAGEPEDAAAASDSEGTDELATLSDDGSGQTADGADPDAAADEGETRTKEITYTVREVNDGQADVTYDTHEVTVTMTVTDDGKGKITAKASYEGDTTFTNKLDTPDDPPVVPEESDDDPDEPTKHEKSSTHKSSKSSKATSQKGKTVPRTGDDTPVATLMVVALASGMVALLASRRLAVAGGLRNYRRAAHAKRSPRMR